jgi:hypothetical protein
MNVLYFVWCSFVIDKDQLIHLSGPLMWILGMWCYLENFKGSFRDGI